jgi:hypothetical protein
LVTSRLHATGIVSLGAFEGFIVALVFILWSNASVTSRCVVFAVSGITVGAWVALWSLWISLITLEKMVLWVLAVSTSSISVSSACSIILRTFFTGIVLNIAFIFLFWWLWMD